MAPEAVHSSLIRDCFRHNFLFFYFFTLLVAVWEHNAMCIGPKGVRGIHTRIDCHGVSHWHPVVIESVALSACFSWPKVFSVHPSLFIMRILLSVTKNELPVWTHDAAILSPNLWKHIVVVASECRVIGSQTEPEFWLSAWSLVHFATYCSFAAYSNLILLNQQTLYVLFRGM